MSDPHASDKLVAQDDEPGIPAAENAPTGETKPAEKTPVTEEDKKRFAEALKRKEAAGKPKE